MTASEALVGRARGLECLQETERENERERMFVLKGSIITVCDGVHLCRDTSGCRFKPDKC